MYYKRTVAEINLDAVDFNIKRIREKVPSGVRILGTVKADGYGHGAVEVSEVLKENGVDIFAVAMLDEAVHLRKNGIDDEILILGFTPANYISEVIKYDIIQTVSSIHEAQIISAEAKKQNKTAKVHIKIDTGMGRLGFPACPESVKKIIDIAEMDNLVIDGIFTHFAVSDIKDKSFTKIKRDKFVCIINSLEESGVNIPVKHCANSAAIIDFDDLFFNMVRPGIILYGLYPSDEVRKENLPLMPAMSLKTQVSFIKEVEDKTTISYGRTYAANGRRKIATLPVGYADGFSRLLSNKGFAVVGGVKVPITGRICMDQCMVDITDVDGVEVQDEIVLIGRMGNAEITADEVAEIIGTINYEVVCMIDKRVPRVYFKGGKIVKEVNAINS